MAEYNSQFVHSEEMEEFPVPITEELKASNGQEEEVITPNQGDSQVVMMNASDSSAVAVTNSDTMEEQVAPSMDLSAEVAQHQPSSTVQSETTATPADMIKWLWSSSNVRLTVPAVVIHVMRTAANTIFPYEIGLTVFTLEQKIIELATCSLDLLEWNDTFTLLPNVGPVLNLHHELPGIPYQNWVTRGNWIIYKLEEFLRRYAHPSIGRPFIFCPAVMQPTVEWCMDQYYGFMGKQFEHPIYPLEHLMVALSEGGLKSVAKHEIETLTFAEQFIKFTVSSVAAKKTNGEVVTPDMISESVGFKTIHPANYFIFGKEMRMAADNADHVAAFLGAFFTEQDAAVYLHEMLGDCLSTDANVQCKHGGKKHESEYRSMATTLWVTYLILDAVMINYQPFLRTKSWLSKSDGTPVPTEVQNSGMVSPVSP